LKVLRISLKDHQQVAFQGQNSERIDKLAYICDIYGMFDDLVGFDWDKGNFLKNWESHQVSHLEAEQVFFNEPLLVYTDEKHSKKESRWYVLGRTDEKRNLMIVFTIRSKKIRVISARSMSRKERKIYEREN